MTVSSAIATATLNWTGVETQFAPGFQAQNTSDVAIVALSPTFVVTPLTLNVHYTAALDSADNYSAAPLAPMPTAPQTLIFVRGSTPLQIDAFEDGVPWSAETIEQALDLCALRDQELKAGLAGTLRGQPGEILPPLPRANLRAGTALMFDSSGNPLLGAPNVLTLAPATATTLGGVKIGQGLNVLSDGTVSLLAIEYWLQRDFGAKGDGVTWDTVAINQWVAQCQASQKRGRAEPGRYMINGAKWVIDTTANTSTGIALWGSGNGNTIFDVTNCTDALTQFLLTDTNPGGGSYDGFYVYLQFFQIYGNAPGKRVATFGPEPNSGTFTFPHYFNGVVTDLIIVNAATAANSVGLRMNGLITCDLRLQVNGPAPLIGTGPTFGVEIAQLNMSKGAMIVGGWNYAIHYLTGYSFGNRFEGCDFETLQSVFIFDSPYAPGDDRYAGQFVWGAVTANPLTTGQDGTTPLAYANTMSGDCTISGNISSANTPVVAGAARANVIMERGGGQYLFTGGRALQAWAIDGGAAQLNLLSGTTAPSQLSISLTGTSGVINNFSGSLELLAATGDPVIVGSVLEFSDGTKQNHGHPISHVAQPTMPATGAGWLNSNDYGVQVILWAGNVTLVTIYDGVRPTPNTITFNPQVPGETITFDLPPNWEYAATYTGSTQMRVLPKQ